LCSERSVQLAIQQGLVPTCVTPLERTTVAGRSESVMVYRVEDVIQS